MSDRTYRLLLGAVILIVLYFDLPKAMAVLVGILFFEGISNWRLPLLVNWLRRSPDGNGRNMGPRAMGWPVPAEQAWRLLVGTLLLLTAILFKEDIWFLPWFMGFAILGAGVSGVCPMQYGLRLLGCRA